MNVSECHNTVFSLFTYNHYWCYVVALTLYEFFYPLIQKKLPRILRRIGILLFTLVVINVLTLCLAIISLADTSVKIPTWPCIIFDVFAYGFAILLMRYLIEFMCAQSPFSMRGVISGVVVFLVTFLIHSSFGASLFFGEVFCHSKYCFVSQHSLGLLFSLTGFCLHLIVAWWYKNRVREEEYNVYQNVTNIYDRYVQADPRKYDQ